MASTQARRSLTSSAIRYSGTWSRRSVILSDGGGSVESSLRAAVCERGAEFGIERKVRLRDQARFELERQSLEIRRSSLGIETTEKKTVALATLEQHSAAMQQVHLTSHRIRALFVKKSWRANASTGKIHAYAWLDRFSETLQKLMRVSGRHSRNICSTSKTRRAAPEQPAALPTSARSCRCPFPLPLPTTKVAGCIQELAGTDCGKYLENNGKS